LVTNDCPINAMTDIHSIKIQSYPCGNINEARKKSYDGF
jgi:hypothetical protein